MTPYFQSKDKSFTLYNGDSIEVLKQIREDYGDQSIKLVCTSPPYFQQKVYESGSEDWEMNAQYDYIKWCMSWIDTVYKINLGSFWLNVGGKYDDRKSFLMYPFLIAHECCRRGYILRNIICWDKSTAAPFKRSDRLHNQWEPFFFFTRRREGYTFNKGELAEALRISIPSTWSQVEFGKVMEIKKKVQNLEKTVGASGAFSASKKKRTSSGRKFSVDSLVIPDVWRLVNTNSTARWHPAIFSENLIQPIIAACSNPGDIVLDPFMGSGSTARVALNMGRRVIGIELSKEYCDKMIEDIKDKNLIDQQQMGLFSSDEMKVTVPKQITMLASDEEAIEEEEPEIEVDISKIPMEQLAAMAASGDYEFNFKIGDDGEEPF